MAFEQLPRNTEPNAATAPQIFQALISDRLYAKMLIFGEGPDIEAARKKAEERASVKASMRRVIWIPDPSVLSAAQRQRFVIAGQPAVAVGLNGNVAATLSLRRARGSFRVDEAFDLAEKQKG